MVDPGDQLQPLCMQVPECLDAERCRSQVAGEHCCPFPLLTNAGDKQRYVVIGPGALSVESEVVMLPLLFGIVDGSDRAQWGGEEVEGKGIDAFALQFIKSHRIDGVEQIHQAPDSSSSPADPLSPNRDAPLR